MQQGKERLHSVSCVLLDFDLAAEKQVEVASLGRFIEDDVACPEVPDREVGKNGRENSGVDTREENVAMNLLEDLSLERSAPSRGFQRSSYALTSSRG
jgi:hypothetical protein